MIISPEQFPIERRTDPKRQAEAAVFDALAGSGASGHALYEWGAPDRPHRTDFALWLESVGRFCIEVKGGQYTLDGVQWFLRAPDGLEAKSSPLQPPWICATRSIARPVTRCSPFRWWSFPTCSRIR